MADPRFDELSDRRDFFRHLLGEAAQRFTKAAEAKVIKRRYVRPPGALEEMAFLATCTRCGLCSQACPFHVIHTVSASGGLATGTPVVDLTQTPCEACPDIPCAAACPTGALAPVVNGWQGHKLGRIAFLPERCITFEGHHCSVCVDACPVGDRALSLDADEHPVLKVDGCVACGHCVRDCVTSPSSFIFLPLEI